MSTDRTLPVTPAERTAAAMLRAWQAWKPDMTDRGPVHHMLVMFGTAAVVADLVDAETDDLTPAGRELLARVGAVTPAEPVTAIVAFLRAEEARFRRNSKDPAHDAAGRERCANKASVLATVAAYIERGDHLTASIDAPRAQPPEPCVSCPPRTLPVTPAERACATVLRAYLTWIDASEEDETDRDWAEALVMDEVGEALDQREFLMSDSTSASPAGRELLARVGAAERTAWDALPAKERIGYLAYLADDARDVRNDKTDFGPRWIRILRAVSDALARPDAPSAFPPKRKPER